MSIIGRPSMFLCGGSFTFNLPGGNNVNFRAQALSAGWNGVAPLVGTITGNCCGYAGGNVGLTIDGAYPSGVTIINNAILYGTGGIPGNGGIAVVGGFGSSGGNGQDAGHGVYLAVPCIFINNGHCYGAGGGGGGGGSCNNPAHTIGYNGSSGGGGGQYGSPSGNPGGANTSPYGSNAGGDGGGISVAGSAGSTPGGDYFALGGGGGGLGHAILGTANALPGSNLGGYTGSVT